MKAGTAISVAGIDDGIDVDDLSSLLMIRHFEQAVLDLFARGLLNGTTHTCLGQEYVPVALGPLLAPGDFVFSNHRGHGHYLARFDDPEGLLAEMTGREGAVCSGVGGSQHIFRDTYLSTGVQGESLPVAVGTALWFQRTGRPEIAVAYIGDGTWGEGAVYEALNLAALWRLPLLVVVENNGIAQTTPTARAMAGDIAGRAAAFGIDHVFVTGSDVAAIRARLAPVVERTRAAAGRSSWSSRPTASARTARATTRAPPPRSPPSGSTTGTTPIGAWTPSCSPRSRTSSGRGSPGRGPGPGPSGLGVGEGLNRGACR